MKKEAIIMGMPISIIICDKNINLEHIDDIFAYLTHIDNKFSSYKKNSELMKVNRREIEVKNASDEMKQIFELSEKTRIETNGYFNIYHNGKIDTSGIVKGYAIYQSSQFLRKIGYRNFSIEIGGDVQLYGNNQKNKKWRVGLQNPFNLREIVKVVELNDKGIATSGTYKRGNHIYDPVSRKKTNSVVSLTIIAENIYDADRYATAALAMGEKGLQFIESLKNTEGFMITNDKKGYSTSGFYKYIV